MKQLFQKGMSFSGFERDGLYVSRGDGTYLEISGVSGLDSITDGRGCSFADLDNDGDLDVLVTPVQEVARLLFRNNVGQDNGFVRVSLEGTRSARDAFGTVVRLKSPKGTLTKIKLGGSGFLSSSDPRLLFGLGPGRGGDDRYLLEVVWPSGLVETIPGIRPGESLHLIEGQGKVVRVTETRGVLPDPETASERVFRSLALRASDAIPALSLTAVPSFSPVSLRAVLKPARRTLINFWATWCAPCAVEMPELARVYDRLSRSGVDLIGVSLDFGQRDRVRSFLEERSIPYPNFLLSEQDLPRLFASGQITVPLSLLVDGDGRVVQAFSGWSAETRAGIEALFSEE
ncbi:MAG: redoxin domain-containing protein [Acidobacteriota bacterium]